MKVFTALIRCVEKSQAELLAVIEEKQKTTERQAEGLVKDLQQEIAELEKRSSELQQLADTEDHLHLLQNVTSMINTPPPPTKDWTQVSVHQPSYAGTVRLAFDQLKKTLGKEMEKQICEGHVSTANKVQVSPRDDPRVRTTARGATAAAARGAPPLVFGQVVGDQPPGTMSWRSEPFHLPGFPHCGTITIDYDIPNGTQTVGTSS